MRSDTTTSFSRVTKAAERRKDGQASKSRDFHLFANLAVNVRRPPQAKHVCKREKRIDSQVLFCLLSLTPLHLFGVT